MASFFWITVKLVFACFAIILTITGNLVVLFAFYNDPCLLTPSNNFLLSMAIADLLVGLIAMPFYSYVQLHNHWPFGRFFCKIWLTIDDVATMASVLSIVAITIERYWSINHSAHYRRYTTKTRIRIFSLLIWLIPFLNFAPGIWLLESNEDVRTTNVTKTMNSECIGTYHFHTLYLIIAQINFFAWPLVVIIILNTLIVVNLCQRSNRFLTYGNFREQKTNNMQSKEGKQDEKQQQNNENDDQIVSVNNENNRHRLRREKNFKCNKDNHKGSIPASIKEIEKSMIENEIVKYQSSTVIREQLSIGRDEQKIPLRSSNMHTNVGIFLPSLQSKPIDHKSLESTQTVHRSLKQNHKKHLSIFSWGHSSSDPSSRNKNTNFRVNEQRTARRLRRDKRAATSLLILVLVFMIFLLPYVVVVVVGNMFSLESLTHTNGQVYSVAFWLLWLNSTVNPVVYPFIQPKFRDAYRRIFRRLTRRRWQLFSLIISIQRDK